MKKITQTMALALIFMLSANYSFGQWTTNTTPSPDVVRLSATGERVNIGGTTSNAKLTLQESAGGERLLDFIKGGQIFTIDVNAAGQLYFGQNGVAGEYLVFDDDTDNMTLKVVGAGGFHIDGNNTGDTRFSIENGGGTHWIFDDNNDGHSLDIQSANELNFMTNGGNERMTIASGGNVGIGTGAPSTKLHVIGGGNVFRTESASGNGYWAFYAGNVLEMWLQNSNDHMDLTNNKANGDLILRTNGDDVLVDAQNEFRITTGGSGEDVIVDVNGNMGVGTLTPSYKLEVAGDIRINNSSPKLDLQNGGTDYGRLQASANYLELEAAADQNVLLDAAGTGSVIFETNNSTRMTIKDNGNVGIGTTSPDVFFEVLGGQFKLTNKSGTNVAKQSTMIMDHYSGGATEFAYFKAQSSATQNSVNFGGGAGASYAATSVAFFTAPSTTTLNGTERMRIRGDGYMRLSPSGSGSFSHTLSVHGTAGKTGGGVWSAVSDRRLKKNVNKYTDGLDEIMRIKPVTFEYDQNELPNSEGREYVGVIAQDIQKIAPYMVEEVQWSSDEHKSKFDKILTYDGTAIPYMLINAVQSQQKTIIEMASKETALVDDIAILKEDNKNLKTELDELKTLVNELISNSNGQVNIQKSIKNVTINGDTDIATLDQNIPNPFSENTVINYFIPKNIKSASMQIFNSNGQLIKTIGLTNTGNGQINLTANSIPSGKYHYQLVLDNKKIESKTMLIVK